MRTEFQARTVLREKKVFWAKGPTYAAFLVSRSEPGATHIKFTDITKNSKKCGKYWNVLNGLKATKRTSENMFSKK